MKPADALAIVKGKLASRPNSPLDAALVMAEIQTESSFNEHAFLMDRNGGSHGLMQLDLPTARDRGYQGTAQGLYDPATNIEFGIRQLEWIADYLKPRSLFSLNNMIAAYNEGVGNVARGNPDPIYVARVLAARTAWQRALGEGIS